MMNNELFKTSIILLAISVSGFIFWKFVFYIKKNDEKRKKENQIEQIKQVSWLEIKKGRGYGRNKFYLVKIQNNKKKSLKISRHEFEIYLNLGIETKGHQAQQYINRIK